MKKEEYYTHYDQEPEFAKDFSVTNMYSYYTKLPNGETITNVIRLDSEENVLVERYCDGVCQHRDVFSSYEVYKDWFNYEMRLHRYFIEWMDKHEKEKAKVVNINADI